MFYDRFCALALEKGVSQSKAVQDIGLNRAAIAKWKKGSMPSAETLEKLANYFDVSVDSILGSEKKPPAGAGGERDLYWEKYKNADEATQKIIQALLDSKFPQ